MSHHFRRVPVPGEEDAPPPPYSETDLYSNSAAARSATGRSPHSHTAADDSASRVSSSTSDIIYTPPETPLVPRASHRERQDDAEGDVDPTPAAFYFESRPAPAKGLPNDSTLHTINFYPDSRPEDFPYQPSWSARDVTIQDWATFINFLIPDHSMRNNEDILDNKLRAEALSEAATNTSSISGRQHTDGQHGTVRDPAKEAADAAMRMADADEVIWEWNRSFFGPRKMTVRLGTQGGTREMPSIWDSVKDDPYQSREPDVKPQQLASRRRSGSVSSTSSSSSSSSSSSNSSLGNLPNLKSQLPYAHLAVYASRIQAWAGQPNEIRSKQDVKQLKAELKALKTNPNASSVEKTSSKAQIEMMKQLWKQYKRQQWWLRRKNKWERRQRKWSEKRERRTAKREMKAARRDLKRGRNRVPEYPVANYTVPSGGRAGLSFAPPQGPPILAFAAPADPGAHASYASAGVPFQGGFGGRRPRGPPRGGSGPRGVGASFSVQGRVSGWGPSAAPRLQPENNIRNITPSYQGSAAKYRAVAALETEMERKLAEMEATGAKGGAKDREIEALARELEGLRVEADEAYAAERRAKE